MNAKAIRGFIVVITCTLVVVLAGLLFLSPENLGRIVKYFMKLLFKVSGITIKVHGKENIKAKSSYIYVSNHSSLMDIPAIKQALPNNVMFLAKKELFSIPIFGLALKKLGNIPVDRSNRRKAIQSLEVAKEKLKTGYSIWIAPEGTRNIDGTPGRFKKGAFLTAAQAKVSIVPVTICGTWKVLPKNTYKGRDGSVEVFINPPISINENNIEEIIIKVHGIISEDITKWKEVNEHN